MSKKIVFICSLMLVFTLNTYAQYDLGEVDYKALSFEMDLLGLAPTGAITGKIIHSVNYVKGNKQRAEISMLTGHKYAMIYTGGKAYFYYPSEKIAALVGQADRQSQMSLYANYKNKVNLELIGKETLNGELCNVYKTIGINHSGKVWIAKKSSLVKKVETSSVGSDRASLRCLFYNYQKDPFLDDSLFKLPSDVRIVSQSEFMQQIYSPQNMLKGLGNMRDMIGQFGDKIEDGGDAIDKGLVAQEDLDNYMKNIKDKIDSLYDRTKGYY